MRRKTKRLLIEFCLVLIGLGALSAFMIPRFLAAQNINTPQNFPDPVFRRHIEVMLGIEPNGKFWKKDLAGIEKLDLTINAGQEYLFEYNRLGGNGANSYQSKITDLTGIEHLKNIKEFYLGQTTITQLDLSAFSHLTLVNVHPFTQLETFLLSDNPALISVFCIQNKLTHLDFSHCPNLERLECQSNLLTTLNVSNCPKLRYLDCSGNVLIHLDLSNNTALLYLDISRNHLEDMPDLRKHESITALNVEFNNFGQDDLPLIQAIKGRFPPPWNIENDRVYKGFLYPRQNDCYLHKVENELRKAELSRRNR